MEFWIPIPALSLCGNVSMDTGHNFSDPRFPHLFNGYNTALSRESHGSWPRFPEVPGPMDAPPIRVPGTSVPESLLLTLPGLISLESTYPLSSSAR